MQSAGVGVEAKLPRGRLGAWSCSTVRAKLPRGRLGDVIVFARTGGGAAVPNQASPRRPAISVLCLP